MLLLAGTALGGCDRYHNPADTRKIAGLQADLQAANERADLAEYRFRLSQRQIDTYRNGASDEAARSADAEERAADAQERAADAAEDQAFTAQMNRLDGQ